MLFWYMAGIVLSAVLLGAGIIFIQGWLVAIGLLLLPSIAAWGIISSGPGSPFNPYPRH